MEILKSSESKQEEFHVLVVDDNEFDRKFVHAILKRFSCKVTCVDSGVEALNALGLQDDSQENYTDSLNTSSRLIEGPIHFVISDYCMPKLNGYDLLKRIKGSCWNDVPVVIMSAEDVPSRISKCLEEGAEKFLLKPPKISDLERLIEPYKLKFLGHSDNNHVIDTTPELGVRETESLTVINL